MESSEDAIKELRDFAETSERVLASHKDALARHEAILVEEFIEVIRIGSSSRCGRRSPL
jgi:hypothetical protein